MSSSDLILMRKAEKLAYMRALDAVKDVAIANRDNPEAIVRFIEQELSKPLKTVEETPTPKEFNK